ncbi:MAG: copper chaperone PCu(A)C [Chloroflexi bacterium]|nr:copper chaperone PCu(A)C [Chloroflexota bacterium]
MRSSRRFSRSGVTLWLIVLGLLAAGCGAGAGSPPTGGVTVSDAWVRLPTGMSDSTAAYMTVTGGAQADAILGASCAMASMAGIHETTTDASGMTGMHPVDRIEVPAGATVMLQPGGYHVMFEGLTQTLTTGQTVTIELTFEHAGKVLVQAEVRAG